MEDHITTLQIVSRETLQYAAQEGATALVECDLKPELGTVELRRVFLMVLISQDDMVQEDAACPLLTP